MQTVSTSIPIPIAIPTVASAALDRLMACSYDELAARYRAAAAPDSPDALDGILTGRMLAWNRIDRGPVAHLLRRLARSPSFVWQGKTFAAGGGHNRIHLAGLLGRQNLFPFTSRIEPSAFDGRPTVIVDYDRPANPWWMRRIHDEIRQLEPGLFLGLDLWRTRRRTSVGLVWFALAAP